MTELTPIRIPFDDAHIAAAVRVDAAIAPAQALAALNLPPYNGIVVVHGGAGAMDAAHVEAVRRFVVAGIVPLAEQRRLLIVDGGTDSGSARVMGAARRAVGGTYPLLGVVPGCLVSYPGGPGSSNGGERRGGRLRQAVHQLARSLGRTSPTERIPLDVSHSHFLFVDGDTFGVESRLMVGLLQASGKPGVALIINGGEIVFNEAKAHAAAGNVIVTLRGSGRLADRLADPCSAERAQLPPGAVVRVVDIRQPDRSVAVLEQLLAVPDTP